jgi:nitrogen fixation protein NifU and related proteins
MIGGAVGSASDPLADLYQQVILDHAKRRAGDRELPTSDAEHYERNPTCGDEITVQVVLSADGERVDTLAWHGAGCSISMASASVLSELAAGKPVAEVRSMIDSFRELMRSRGTLEPDEDVLGDAVAFQGVSKFVMRVKCAMLSWVAAEACLTKLA